MQTGYVRVNYLESCLKTVERFVCHGIIKFIVRLKMSMHTLYLCSQTVSGY